MGDAPRSGTTRTHCQVVCIAVITAGLLSACSSVAPTQTPISCAPLPDPRETLRQAWQAFQPDQQMPFSIPVRSRLFALQVLLISAGMYDDEATSDPASLYAEYAPQFVRDFGMSRNPGLKDAFAKFNQTLLQARDRSEADFGNNCGLILARRMLRDDPVGVSSDWVLEAVTWGFAPTFQESIRQLVLSDAKECSRDPQVQGVAELVLDCTTRRVGL